MKKTARSVGGMFHAQFRLRRHLIAGVFAVLTTGWLLAIAGSCDHKPLYLDVPFVTTPDYVVDRMLEMTNVGPGDYLIDLGSGDGRIVIAAAKRGAFGHGVDIDPERIREARQNALEAEVADRVMFLRENLFRTDFSRASVVTMFLMTTINRQLRPRLFKMLRPGTKVVSHKFDMGDWKADRSAMVRGPKHVHEIYMWIMPAQMAGRWEWQLADRRYTLTVHQHFQEITLQLFSGTDTLKVDQALLRGKRVKFAVQDNEQHFRFSGRVEKDRITGYAHIRSGDEKRVVRWTARRSSSGETQ